MDAASAIAVRLEATGPLVCLFSRKAAPVLEARRNRIPTRAGSALTPGIRRQAPPNAAAAAILTRISPRIILLSLSGAELRNSREWRSQRRRKALSALTVVREEKGAENSGPLDSIHSRPEPKHLEASGIMGVDRSACLLVCRASVRANKRRIAEECRKLWNSCLNLQFEPEAPHLKPAPWASEETQ